MPPEIWYVPLLGDRSVRRAGNLSKRVRARAGLEGPAVRFSPPTRGYPASTFNDCNECLAIGHAVGSLGHLQRLQKTAGRSPSVR